MPEAVAVNLETKACPRCGEMLFSDMVVCYGCLYDFTRKKPRPLLPEPPRVETNVPDSDLGHLPSTQPVEPRQTIAALPACDAIVEDASCSGNTEVLASSSMGVLIRTHDVDVCVPLPKRGLVVGREEDCDIVLHSATVSRRHLSIKPTPTGAVVGDLGATNPAVVRGERVGEATCVGVGDIVGVCESQLVIVDRVHRDGRAASEFPTMLLGVPA